MMEPKNTKSIAVVSGKGGSGKTMLTATLAKILDHSGFSTLLIDADFGTAGLTYYLGLNQVSNISVGLTNLLSNSEKTSLSLEQVIQKCSSSNSTDLIGVGDHRRYKRDGTVEFFHEYFFDLLGKIKESNVYDYIIVDCRGGIDDESLTVCKSVDSIFVVAETDTTSFQATQHLVDVLYDSGVSNKMVGFFVNKVFDDPSLLIKNGVVSFKTKFLSSIPFDLDAIKSFIVGDIPGMESVYTNQIWHGLVSSGAFPGVAHPESKLLESSKISNFIFSDKYVQTGEYFISIVLFFMYSTIGFAVYADITLQEHMVVYLMVVGFLLFVSTSSKFMKRSVGMIVSEVVETFTRKK